MAIATVLSEEERYLLERIARGVEGIRTELALSNHMKQKDNEKEPPPDNSWLNKDDAEDGTDLISYVNEQLKKRFRK